MVEADVPACATLSLLLTRAACCIAAFGPASRLLHWMPSSSCGWVDQSAWLTHISQIQRVVAVSGENCCAGAIEEDKEHV